MATRFIFSVATDLIFPFPILEFLLKTKALSLSSGVYFDIVNYVYGRVTNCTLENFVPHFDFDVFCTIKEPDNQKSSAFSLQC